jgi:hypothetical protein
MDAQPAANAAAAASIEVIANRLSRVCMTSPLLSLVVERNLLGRGTIVQRENAVTQGRLSVTAG